jgi:hypothetical protein
MRAGAPSVGFGRIAMGTARRGLERGSTRWRWTNASARREPSSMAWRHGCCSGSLAARERDPGVARGTARTSSRCACARRRGRQTCSARRTGPMPARPPRAPRACRLPSGGSYRPGPCVPARMTAGGCASAGAGTRGGGCAYVDPLAHVGECLGDALDLHELADVAVEHKPGLLLERRELAPAVRLCPALPVGRASAARRAEQVGQHATRRTAGSKINRLSVKRKSLLSCGGGRSDVGAARYREGRRRTIG